MWELGWIDHTHTYTRRSLSARNEHWWAANAFLHVLFWESTDRKLCLTARLKVKTWMKWPTLCMATQNGWFKRKRGHICRSIGSPILAPASGFFLSTMYKECKSVHVQARQQHQLGPTEFLLPSMGHAMLWQSGSPASFGSGLRLSYGSRRFEPEGIERDSRFHDIWVCHGLPKPGYTRTPQNPSRSNRSSLLIIRRKMIILGYRTLPFHLRSRLHTAGSSRRGEHNRSVSTTTDTGFRWV